MQKLVSFFLSVVFFVIYFLVLRYIYNAFVPFNTLTDILSILIVLIVIIPVSVLTAEKTIEMIRTSEKY